MHLLQAKIRHLDSIGDSGWFRTESNLTILTGENRQIVSTILRILEALNPLYNINTRSPFLELPKTWQQGGYQRHVIPEKMTAIFGIYDSDPELVKTLSIIEEKLIETDKIEVGRRLDYSRWISFIGIPASARWSDMRKDMHQLKELLDNGSTPVIGNDDRFFNTCRETTRIRDEVSNQCRRWLRVNKSRIPQSHAYLYEKCLEKVNVHERSKIAWKLVAEELPPLIRLVPQMTLRNEYNLDENIKDIDFREPIPTLIRLARDRYDLLSQSNDSRRRFHEEVSAILSTPEMKRCEITLLVSSTKLLVKYQKQPNANVGANSISLIWMVILLVRLLWRRPPILLLDYSGADLPEKKWAGYMEHLQLLSKVAQVILAPPQYYLQEGQNSFAVLHATSDGRIT